MKYNGKNLVRYKLQNYNLQFNVATKKIKTLKTPHKFRKIENLKAVQRKQ